MDTHWALSIAACSGHLGLAILIWLRRGQSRIARVLTLLFLDMFAWNFADLACHLSGAEEWHWVDRIFSSLMPALGLHVVVMFVGKARALRKLVWASYLVFGLIATQCTSPYWWILPLAAGAGAMLYAAKLLVLHHRHTSDLGERARTQLVLLAIAMVTLVGSTDLWFDAVPLPVPRLSNVGTLAAMALFAIAVMRLRLLGADTPPALVAYALGLGVLGVIGYSAAVQWLDPHAGLAVLAVLSGTFLVFVVAHELLRISAAARERGQRLVLLGRFSEQLAHDLRNPLAALKGAVQFLLAERAAGHSLDDRAEFIELMLEQVERVQAAIDKYLNLTKVEPAAKRSSVNEVVRSVLALHQLAPTPGVDVRVTLDERIPDSQIDRDLIAAALENLLRNACQAMPAGGTVNVRTEASTDDQGTECVVVSVEDSGRGMDPRELERATEALFTTKPGGSGLGLSFAERVATAHGGRLDLTSSIGKGTAVRLSLPVGK
jgi:signal transduction histidine kinase